jgi:glyoxylase-like metal-dependent hydrolase (beta-lactamase superfamily II)
MTVSFMAGFLQIATMFPGQSIELKIKGQPAKIHLVSTGAVSVKTKFREATKTGFLAMIDFILDKKFTEWMPIWVLIIEHPEGVFVIDTGENADVNNPGYFKSSGMFANWFDTTQFKFIVESHEEIGPQLDQLNIPLEKIKAVVLTHLHLDHIDGLKYFPSTPIIVNRKEWERPFGDLPKLYPSWFRPTLVDLDEQYDVFDHVRYLTAAKDLVLIETPGHTYHHCSVLLNADECSIFFAADICYTQNQVIEEKYSGTNASHKMAKNTYDRVKLFSKRNKLVFIPSHDAAASARLRSFSLLVT